MVLQHVQFAAKPLNDLIEQSLKNNPDVKASQAALLVARENVVAQRGADYPNVAASSDLGDRRSLGGDRR